MKTEQPYNYGPFKNIAWLPEIFHCWLDKATATLRQAVREKDYDRLFRWSITASVIMMLLSAWITALLSPPDESMELFGTQKELLAISRHTLVVINAVQRTSLAKRRIKVPKYKPTELAVKEIDTPEPELGSLEIGLEIPEVQGSPSGSPTGQARVRRPELLMLVPPLYPRDAEKKKIEGTVDLRIHVTTSGTVDQVEIINSSGLESMDDAAVKAAQKTRFRPGIKDGRATPMWIYYPVQFTLNKK